ncbi:Uncharacterised nucleotidyltransferase [Actinacidiphila yanglinensis]|uniref:Uncharacterized nucleotidyltransferase n=1 Tax=Actinacidiphila yanglinensis TaxID=310779 RepID=A0A1H5TZ49_9ACTN|nr:nucleotidyltransferase family protein [Actinacidiphila yanglinensis]SEF68010.1 Uncharacterised nucleotidyltransferase [Actinacidiphila yanglinensis]
MTGNRAAGPAARRAERDGHLLALRSLSALQPRHPLERSLAAIEALGAQESHRFLDSLRMRSLVARRLAAVESAHPAVRACAQALAPKVARLRHMHDVLDDNLKRLEQLAIRLGVELFGGKGISAHATYTDRSARDFNDLDLFVRTRADATALSRVLRHELGFRYQKYELPWFKLDPSDGMLYGQIALVAPDGSPDLVNADIHFGDYSVRHCGRLDITGMYTGGAPGLRMVPAEENLACIVNNAAGDYFVTAKDTNDLLMALSLPGFDADRFAGLLRSSHLAGFFGFVARTLEASSVLTAEQRGRLAAIPTPRTAEPAPRPDAPDWNRRCAGTALHAFATRRADGIVPAVRVAADAFGYYRRHLKLELAPGGRQSPVRPFALNPWTCVRLVPVDLAVALLDEGTAGGRPATLPERRSFVGTGTDVERIDTPAGMYVRVEEEFFVATVLYRLDPRLVRQAAAAAAAAPAPAR